MGRRFRPLALAALAAFGISLSAACEQEGPAEQAGREIDEAAEGIADAIEDAVEEAEDR